MAQFRDVVRFGDAVAHENTAAISDAAANGDTAAISDVAAVGNVAPFDVTYKMHAFHPRQYICTLRMARRGEARLYCYLPR